jgi:hypothetical protein
MKPKSILLICLLSVIATACAKTTSENVKTGGFFASYSVKGNNTSSVECVVRFQVGGGTGTSLELSGSDRVTCDGQSMTKEEALGIVTYRVVLPYRQGHDYQVVLSRAGEPAYLASATLPEPILNMNPAAPVVLQKGTSLQVSWTPSLNPSDEMNVMLNFSAGKSSHYRQRSDNAPENGNVVFDGQATRTESMESGSWHGSVQITRRRSGQMPSGLGGSISAEQTRTFGVTLND